MPTIQSGKNILVAYKAESAFNAVPGVASGATRFRPNPSPGMEFKRQQIPPNELRADLKTSMARLGFGEGGGSYAADLSVGTFDPLLEALMRGTWSAALVITTATMTTITFGANTIVAAAGSWLTQGIRIGDVIKCTGTATPANNGRNLRVTGVTASTITVAETLTVNAAGDATGSITRAKKVFQPGAGALVRRSFTIEEQHQDIGKSEQYTGCRIASLKITGQPNGMCTGDFAFVGAAVNALNAPYYTAPTLSASIGLVIADATIRYAGSDILTLTAFDLTIDNHVNAQPVIGGIVAPDVFDNTASLMGSISAMRLDLTNLTKFTSETEFDMQVLLVEPMAEPKNFLSIYLPRVKLGGLSAPFGQDGAMVEQLPLLIGDREVVTGYDDTMVAFSTSAP